MLAQKCQIVSHASTSTLRQPVQHAHRSPSSHASGTARLVQHNRGPTASLSVKTEEASVPGRPSPLYVTGLICSVIVLGVSNRVLYKLALVPLRNYVFFLAQLQNLGYLVVYFSFLAWRLRTGKATQDMLDVPKLPFLLIGACEAMAQVLFMMGAARLPGALLPVIGQMYIIWMMSFSSLLLGTRYSKSQIFGVCLIMLGVASAAVPPHFFQGVLQGPAGGPRFDLFAIFLCVACYACAAFANIVKEGVFKSQQKRLGRPLDIFVVNSFGSATQAMFVLLLLPVTTSLSGLPLDQLGQYLTNGAVCIMGGSPACGSVCTGAPGFPVAYVAANLAFNIAILTLLRTVGSVTTTIFSSMNVPLQILAFVLLPLPYLDPVSLSANFWWGAAVTLCGLVSYNYSLWKQYSAPKAHAD